MGDIMDIFCRIVNKEIPCYKVYEDDLVEFQTKRAFRQIYTSAQIAEMTFCFLTGVYLLKAMRPPDSRPPAM